MITHGNCIASIGALTESRESGNSSSTPALQPSPQDCEAKSAARLTPILVPGIASMLPPSEGLDRTITYLAMYSGSCMGFISSCQKEHTGAGRGLGVGSLDFALTGSQLVSDITALQPTIMITEPVGLGRVLFYLCT